MKEWPKYIVYPIITICFLSIAFPMAEGVAKYFPTEDQIRESEEYEESVAESIENAIEQAYEDGREEGLDSREEYLHIPLMDEPYEMHSSIEVNSFIIGMKIALDEDIYINTPKDEEYEFGYDYIVNSDKYRPYEAQQMAFDSHSFYDGFDYVFLRLSTSKSCNADMDSFAEGARDGLTEIGYYEY